MASEEFVDLVEEGRQNDLDKYNDDPLYFGAGFDPTILTDPLANFDLSTGVDTDWLDEVTRSAAVSNYELSLGGGTDKTKYYTSFIPRTSTALQTSALGLLNRQAEYGIRLTGRF